eukprot:SAG31_NODE_5773_length_2332_cov_3.196149_1_plen_127_part_00
MVLSDHPQASIWNALTEIEHCECGEIAEGVRNRARQLSLSWPHKSKVSCMCARMVLSDHPQASIWNALTEIEHCECDEIAEGVRNRAKQPSLSWPHKSKVSCMCARMVFSDPQVAIWHILTKLEER